MRIVCKLHGCMFATGCDQGMSWVGMHWPGTCAGWLWEQLAKNDHWMSQSTRGGRPVLPGCGFPRNEMIRDSSERTGVAIVCCGSRERPLDSDGVKLAAAPWLALEPAASNEVHLAHTCGRCCQSQVLFDGASLRTRCKTTSGMCLETPWNAGPSSISIANDADVFRGAGRCHDHPFETVRATGASKLGARARRPKLRPISVLTLWISEGLKISVLRL